MKKISIIVAIGENWVMGKQGGLPWRLPADLKHFKALTTGHTVIMGRKTFDSIGRPLPNRTNIVMSRNNDLTIPGCIRVKSVEEALDAAPDNQDIFIVGGGEIYQQSLPFVQQIYLTRIDHKFEGDIFFPELNSSEWIEIDKKNLEADEKNPYNYSVSIFQRKNLNNPQLSGF
ncbi:MAG: dihydrofolate reductase [bacterium]|nr:dihydrofolate reductase [bacterium]